MHNFSYKILISNFLESNIGITFYQSLIDILTAYIEKGNPKGFLHPLGFVMITLLDWNNNERLRLHIWPKDERKYNNNQSWIHNHEYSVKSLVLSGILINEEYKILNEGVTQTLPLYRVGYEKNNSDLILTSERCEAILLKREELNFGDLYKVEKWQFHKVDVPNNQVTCTLVLNYDKESSTGFVIGSSDLVKPFFPFTREIYDNDKLIDLISTLITTLTERCRAYNNEFGKTGG